MAEACVSFVSVPFESLWPPGLKAAVYTCGMLYCFLGLGLIAQQYMSAMDNIVQQTRTVTYKDEDSGAIMAKEVKIWNPTIADITLLALGTSAPPISLAIISALQQLGKPSTGADVGTGTMLGGAAFNFFAILAACILIPRNGSIKRVSNFGVFLVELVWSIWAYVWLFIVFSVWTPGRVTVFEALLTVLHMPVLMLHAYAQDQQWPLVSLAYPRHADRLPRHEEGGIPQESDALDTLLAKESSDELYGVLCGDLSPSLAQPGALALSTSAGTGVLALSPNSLALGTSTGRTSSARGGAAADSRGCSLDIEAAASAPDEAWGGRRPEDSVADLVSPLRARGLRCGSPPGACEGIREEEGESCSDNMDEAIISVKSVRDSVGNGHVSAFQGGSSLVLEERALSERAQASCSLQGQTWVSNASDCPPRPSVTSKLVQVSPDTQGWGMSEEGLRLRPQGAAHQSSDGPHGNPEAGGVEAEARIQGGGGTEGAAAARMLVGARQAAEFAPPELRLDLSCAGTPATSPEHMAGSRRPVLSSPPGEFLLREQAGHREAQTRSGRSLARSTGSSTGASGDAGGAALRGVGEQERSGRQMGPERAASSPPWTPELLGTSGAAPSLLSLRSLSKEGMRRRSFVERDRALEDPGIDRDMDKDRESEGERTSEVVLGSPERETVDSPRESHPAAAGGAARGSADQISPKSKEWDGERERNWSKEERREVEPTARLLVAPDLAGVPFALHVPYSTLHVHPRHTAGAAQMLSPPLGSRKVEAGILSQTSPGPRLPDRDSEVNQSKYRGRGARPGSLLGAGGGIPPALQQQCQQAWALCCYVWRLLFAAVVPPSDALHGWPAFLVSIGVISGVSMVVIELANVLGCVTGIDSFIISMTLLASGTAIPNIIASSIAAQQSPHADSALANVNASNSINVYLGLGLPWVITSTYDSLILNKAYTIDASSLGSSLLVYFGTIGVGLAILFGRRWIVGGELGGNRTWALVSAAGLLGLWAIYCALSLSLYYHVQ